MPGDDGGQLGSRGVALRGLLRELRLGGARFFPRGAELDGGFFRGIFGVDKGFGGHDAGAGRFLLFRRGELAFELTRSRALGGELAFELARFRLRGRPRRRRRRARSSEVREILLGRLDARPELLRLLRQSALALVRLRQRLPGANQLGFLRQQPAFVFLRDLGEDALQNVGPAGRRRARRRRGRRPVVRALGHGPARVRAAVRGASGGGGGDGSGREGVPSRARRARRGTIRARLETPLETREPARVRRRVPILLRRLVQQVHAVLKQRRRVGRRRRRRRRRRRGGRNRRFASRRRAVSRRRDVAAAPEPLDVAEGREGRSRGGGGGGGLAEGVAPEGREGFAGAEGVAGG